MEKLDNLDSSVEFDSWEEEDFSEHDDINNTHEKTKENSPRKKYFSLLFVFLIIVAASLFGINSFYPDLLGSFIKKYDQKNIVATAPIVSVNQSNEAVQNMNIASEVSVDIDSSLSGIDEDNTIMNETNIGIIESSGNVLTPLPDDFAALDIDLPNINGDISPNKEKTDVTVIASEEELIAKTELAFDDIKSEVVSDTPVQDFVEKSGSDLVGDIDAYISSKSKANDVINEQDNIDIIQTVPDAPVKDIIEQVVEAQDISQKENEIDKIKDANISNKAEEVKAHNDDTMKNDDIVVDIVEVKKDAPKKTVPKKVRRTSWVVRAAQPGKAMIYDKISREQRSVEAGMNVPGVGLIKSIAKKSGRWVVSGTKSSVYQ